jgi:sigma-B regulation protein RsbU (phosphoserine phosphatase)
MSSTPPTARPQPEYEGDYRPVSSDNPHAHLDPLNVRIESTDLTFLAQMADTLNTTLDLQTLLNRISEMVRSIIPYRIFSILLLNERTNDLRMRFQIGHTPEAQRMRFPLGKGVVGQVAQTRQSMLINDVTAVPGYIPANPNVCSELAIPLIAKNRLIGVLDLES